MRVTRELNLSIQVDREDGSRVYVHTTPIGRDVFEANYRLIAMTWADMMEAGTAFAFGAGPKIASMMIRDAGKKIAATQGDDIGDGGAGSFLAEVERMTALVAPTGAGWETIPLATAVKRDNLDPEEYQEMLNAVVFFTLVCAMTRLGSRQKIAETMASAMGAALVPSNCTEFAASLPRSMQADTNGPAAASSVPS